jgi:hypothetical protein
LENLEFNDLPSFLLFIHCMLNTARQFAIWSEYITAF